MKVETIKKGKKNTYILTIDKKKFVLYDDLIVKYCLLPKKELTIKELESIQKENNNLEAYYVALKLIANRLRTKKEIKNSLSKKEFPASSIQNAIEKLEKEGYIKEENYIKAYLNDAFHFSNDGPYKIKRKLVDLGNSEEKIENELNNISKKDWLQKLEKLFSKKATSNHKEGINKWRPKCEMYFYNLGYPKDWIEEISQKQVWEEQKNLIEKEYNKLYQKWSRKLRGEELKFQLKRKLYEKGFTKEQIQQLLENK